MTTNVNQTIQNELNQADLNTLADVARKIKLGHMLSPIKVTFAALGSSATQDITTAAARAAATIVGADPAFGSTERLPPIGHVLGLRVTAGAAQAGPRVTTDAGGTAAAGATGLGGAGGGVATLSDDGKTLVFEAAVTGFVLYYVPRAAVPITDVFVPST